MKIVKINVVKYLKLMFHAPSLVISLKSSPSQHSTLDNDTMNKKSWKAANRVLKEIDYELGWSVSKVDCEQQWRS